MKNLNEKIKLGIGTTILCTTMIMLEQYKSALYIFIIGVALILILDLFEYIKKKKYLNSKIYQIDTMTGIEFENLLKYHFSNLGYKVKTTPTSSDYGADLILKNDESKIVVQAKRYKNKVGIKAVQEIIGAIGYYEADKGMVVTNSYFTTNAINLAKSNDIELWDRNKLIEVFKV